MATYAVIGLGQLGSSVATHLSKEGVEVIAIDSDERRVDAIKDEVAQAVVADATDENALRAAGIEGGRTVVLALGESQLEEAVLATMALRELNVGKIISRAGSDTQARVLLRVGVTEVRFPERDVGQQIAREILAPGVKVVMSLSKTASVVEAALPDHAIGKTLGELQLRANYGLNVVAVIRRSRKVSDDGRVDDQQEILSVLGPTTKLLADDFLVMVGSESGIQGFVSAAS